MNSKTIKRISLFLIIVFSLMVGNLYGASLSSKEIFKSAQEAYRYDKNKKALRLFLEFRKEFPKDKRADDALLYIGRIYKRMGKIDMAIESFRMILDLPEKSNRFKEASFELARIYYKKMSYEQVILLLKPFQKLKDFDKHDFRLLRLLAKTRYQLGKESNKQNKKEITRKNFLESIEIYALLTNNDSSDKDRVNYLIGMSESLFYLERLAKDNKNDISAKIYRESSQEVLKYALALNKDEKMERYLTKQLRKISTENKTSLIKKSFAKIELELLGKTNSKDDSKDGGVGSEISLKGSYRSPVNNGKQYRLSGSFRHDDFNFKTSNFRDDEIDEKRLIQETDEFSVQIEKLKGLKSSLDSRLTLEATSLDAEDYGEDYKSVELSEKFRFRLNNNWKLGFLGSASWKSYPDYYVSDSERDYVTLELSPDITRHINKSFNLNFSYSFYLKQYLNSKYDLKLQDDKGDYMPSDEDKRYLTHSFVIMLEGNKKKFLYPSLEYIFTINETVHYDKETGGTFIKDYGDFMKHKIIAGVAFTGFRDFEIDAEVSAFIKNFSHYPARDSENQFIDEMRKDKFFQFDTSIEYLISTLKENRLGNIFLKIQLFYEYQTSNMKYEVSSKTNYDFLTFSAGLKVDLP